MTSLFLCQPSLHILTRFLYMLAWCLAAMTGFGQIALAADALPEPGPESSGLRLRWVVTPREKSGKEGFDVHVDLLNVSAKPIVIKGAWEKENSGGAKEYLEHSLSIESMPEFQPWRGATGFSNESRTSPQPELTIASGETLTLRWQTEGRQLKNHVSDLFAVHNPHFRMPGLYSVHATLDVITSSGTVFLRSNEQLVSTGGSRAMPKHTFGPLWSANLEKKTATLGLGARHNVQVGDHFDITSKQYAWRVTITEVSPRYSEGTLENLAKDPKQIAPEPNAGAVLAGDEVK